MKLLPASDRDKWYDENRKNFARWVMQRARQREDVSEGLKAIATAWFDEFEDETDLPEWFHQAVEFAMNSLGELNIPGSDDEDNES
jgi:hypothetical protein